MAELAERPRDILELKGIYKDFEGLQVLFDINLGVHEGERHAIIGPNGAGKSTLFNLITGKYRPSRGRIFLKGEAITGANPFKLDPYGDGSLFPDYQYFPDDDRLRECAKCHSLQEQNSL